MKLHSHSIRWVNSFCNFFLFCISVYIWYNNHKNVLPITKKIQHIARVETIELKVNDTFHSLRVYYFFDQRSNSTSIFGACLCAQSFVSSPLSVNTYHLLHTIYTKYILFSCWCELNVVMLVFVQSYIHMPSEFNTKKKEVIAPILYRLTPFTSLWIGIVLNSCQFQRQIMVLLLF